MRNPKPDEEGVIDKDISDTRDMPDDKPEKGSEGL
jgi:hypothetical protein